jgi:hypothetical protein
LYGYRENFEERGWKIEVFVCVLQDVPRKATVMEVKRNGGGGAFQPFHREKSVGKSNASVGKAPSSLAPEPAPAVAVATTSSSAETTTVGNGGSGGSDRREDKEGQAQRKQRRNWSPELHKRFLSSLQQLGGSQGVFLKENFDFFEVNFWWCCCDIVGVD